ncbi:2723_t:CDS:2 [Funneliformis geosporum]|nr:2723_t:CDS:2 [Funneliformis geosporum]
MVSQISCWQVPSPTWGKDSFDNLRDFCQPPPPGVDFAYQKCNVSTNLPSYNIFESFIHIPQPPHETSSTHTSHTKTSYTDHSIISRSLDCHPTTEKDQPSKNTSNNKKKKLKKKNSAHNCEVDQKFHHEILRAELKPKESLVEIIKRDLKFRPNYYSLNKQPLKNDESKCVAMKLPLEILVMIAENSTAETLLALTLTCQKWYNWLTEIDSTYIGRVWCRSRNNSHSDRKGSKAGKCELIYTIQKMKPKPSWLHECDMCYKKSNILTWNFRGSLINTCYSCKKMYEVKTNDKEIY